MIFPLHNEAREIKFFRPINKPVRFHILLHMMKKIRIFIDLQTTQA